jgi:hypothetical protein
MNNCGGEICMSEVIHWHNRVNFGKQCSIQENVTLGHLEDGLLTFGDDALLRSRNSARPLAKKEGR